MADTSQDRAWQQIKAGVSLVKWSKLANWNEVALCFQPTSADGFEGSLGHASVDSDYGRLICWLGFETGSEYITKGVCILVGGLTAKKTSTVRAPADQEVIGDWADRVNANDPSIRSACELFPTLGGLADSIDAALAGDSRGGVTRASIAFLVSAVRNRDAHAYVRSVRASGFRWVEELFVPALNSLLGRLDQSELRSRL